MQINIKFSSKVFQILLFQLIGTDFWLSPLSWDIIRPYNLLISENVSKFYMWKAKTTSETQQLLLIYTGVNISFNYWTKFLPHNREPSKAFKFNHHH